MSVKQSAQEVFWDKGYLAIRLSFGIIERVRLKRVEKALKIKKMHENLERMER